MTNLFIYGKALITLGELSNDLTVLDCSINLLKELPLLPPGLKELWCYTNFLTELPPLPITLTVISCCNNKLTDLPTLPKGLYILRCYNNPFTQLPQLPHSIYHIVISPWQALSCLNNLSNPKTEISIKN